MIHATVASPEDQAVAAALREFGERLFDPWWRLTSGAIYKIITKGEGDDETVQPFIPNPIQLDFLSTLHTREALTKCRQVGFTTLSAIYLFDHAEWNANQRCAHIAQDLDKVVEIFRDKVRFTYDNQPDVLKQAFPLKKATETMLHFGHNDSIIFVDTSTRGGTINRLHISEFGKISVQGAGKAKEIVTGAFPSVPANGVIIVESTAEGQEGEFHRIAHHAEARSRSPEPLRPLEWKHRFYAWWEHDGYEIDPEGVPIGQADHRYFNEVEARIVLAGKRPAGFSLSLRKRAWYVDFRRNMLGDDRTKMWQEHPSTFEEAWLRSPEGVFFADQLSQATAAGRIGPMFRHAPFIPVNTFWDIGSRDGTAIWLHQIIHPEHRMLGHIEGWFKGYNFFVGALDRIAEAAPEGWIWGTHYLPHDADQKRQMQHRVASPIEMLREMKPTWRFEIVPPVSEKEHARSALRRVFPFLTFFHDETIPDDPEGQAPDCRRGIRHLWNYRKKRNVQTGGWSDEEFKNEAREAADALMQLAQAFDNLNPTVRAGQRPKRTGARRRMA